MHKYILVLLLLVYCVYATPKLVHLPFLQTSASRCDVWETVPGQYVSVGTEINEADLVSDSSDLLVMASYELPLDVVGGNLDIQIRFKVNGVEMADGSAHASITSTRTVSGAVVQRLDGNKQHTVELEWRWGMLNAFQILADCVQNVVNLLQKSHRILNQ